MADQLDSSNLNPIWFAKEWSYIRIVGKRSPGAIPRNGIRGFERVISWDQKQGKGTPGATSTIVGIKPAEGSVSFQLWLASHFEEWSVFRDLLKYSPGKKHGASAADAISIFHPSLSGLGISNVVTSKISPERHMGNGLYMVTVDFIEWLPAPNVSMVQTTAQAKNDTESTKPGNKTPPNPEIVSLKLKLAAVSDVFQRQQVQ